MEYTGLVVNHVDKCGTNSDSPAAGGGLLYARLGHIQLKEQEMYAGFNAGSASIAGFCRINIFYVLGPKRLGVGAGGLGYLSC